MFRHLHVYYTVTPYVHVNLRLQVACGLAPGPNNVTVSRLGQHMKQQNSGDHRS